MPRNTQGGNDDRSGVVIHVTFPRLSRKQILKKVRRQQKNLHARLEAARREEANKGKKNKKKQGGKKPQTKKRGK